MKSSRYVRLPEVLNVADLQDRWPGALENELREMVLDNTLPPYKLVEQKMNPEGKMIFLCSSYPRSLQLAFTPLPGWEELVFSVRDIINLEEQHPEFEPASMRAEENENLCSQNGSVDKDQDTTNPADDRERLRAEIKELKDKVTRLESELATKRMAPKAKKTAAASEAASNLKAEEWKGHAGHMVKIALQCGLEGPKPRKRPQLQVIAKQNGGELPKTALQVLWKALPDDHISKEPGPQRQG